MQTFQIDPAVFERLENACFGVVAARGIRNRPSGPDIRQLLEESIASCEQHFAALPVKQDPEVGCYRDAFRTLGINPNKYMSSIEALLTRIAKKKGFPSINALVDLGNAVSIRHRLPIGAHDLGTVDECLCVRPALEDDTFIAFGEEQEETPDPEEIVYASGHTVRTRRWIWRQSEIGKITEATTAVLFPIDGFLGVNDGAVFAARDELAGLLRQQFDCEVAAGFLTRDTPAFPICFA